MAEMEYTFNETDEYVNSVVVDFDSEDHVLSWQGYGDFAVEINNCKTVEDFRKTVFKHFKEIDEAYSGREVFEELLTFCDLTIDYNTIQSLKNEVNLLKSRLADLELENLKLKQEKDTVIELYSELVKKEK